MSTPEKRATVAVQPCNNYDDTAVASALSSLLNDLGSIERFIKPGSTVLLKPNLLSPRSPDQAVTTNPALVAAMARFCLRAGAGKVWVGDSCAGDHQDQDLWRHTGMQAALSDLPVELKSFNRSVKAWPMGERQVPVPTWLDQVEVIISMPKLKTHALTLMSCGIKNMYGMIAGGAKSSYHGLHPSPRGMSAFLAGVYHHFKPELTIVDAVIAMEGEGPANGRPKHLGLILGGNDAVAIDAVCAPFIGRSPDQVPLIAESVKRGYGVGNLAVIDLAGLAPDALKNIRLRPSIARWLMRIPEPLFKLTTRFIRCHPKIDKQLCVGCGVCRRICSRQAIKVDSNGRHKVVPARCIMCMCCAESCPYQAVGTQTPIAKIRRLFPLF